jgi:hypothetical protein
VPEAAQALGLTVDAVRSRVKRKTIEHEHVGRRVYVLLDADQARPGHAQQSDLGGGQGTTEDRTAELIGTLQAQLEAERQAHAEARRIIAGLVERMPQLEAPADSAPDARQAPEQGAEQQDRGEPRPDAPGSQEGARRPWWRRVFGG